MNFLRATAAHCVTNDLAELAVLDGFDGNSVVFQTLAGAVGASFSSADIMVHPQYDGEVRNGFDIAIVDLGQALPEGIARYAFNDGSIDETGAHLAAGFGRSGDGGAGAILGAAPAQRATGPERAEARRDRGSRRRCGDRARVRAVDRASARLRHHRLRASEWPRIGPS